MAIFDNKFDFRILDGATFNTDFNFDVFFNFDVDLILYNPTANIKFFLPPTKIAGLAVSGLSLLSSAYKGIAMNKRLKQISIQLNAIAKKLNIIEKKIDLILDLLKEVHTALNKINHNIRNVPNEIVIRDLRKTIHSIDFYLMGDVNRNTLEEYISSLYASVTEISDSSQITHVIDVGLAEITGLTVLDYLQGDHLNKSDLERRIKFLDVINRFWEAVLKDKNDTDIDQIDFSDSIPQRITKLERMFLKAPLQLTNKLNPVSLPNAASYPNYQRLFWSEPLVDNDVYFNPGSELFAELKFYFKQNYYYQYTGSIKPWNAIKVETDLSTKTTYLKSIGTFMHPMNIYVSDQNLKTTIEERYSWQRYCKKEVYQYLIINLMISLLSMNTWKVSSRQIKKSSMLSLILDANLILISTKKTNSCNKYSKWLQ